MSFFAVDLVALSPAEVAHCLADPELSALRGISWVEPGLVPEIVSRTALDRAQRGEDWFWCAPRLFLDTERGQFVGSACFKNSPAAGKVEIGYGVAASRQSRGYATAGAARMCAAAFAHAEIHAVTAETSGDNPASARVLVKNSFRKAGARVDAEDGFLTCWERARGDGEK
jgi:RimJ/RimL family protein N-acetyltransferase